ncbi:hypothetical protein C8A05DRAFT_17779 [Staphylotrichum tortipilum]|uniref:Uncharacterized protein n=1 Tax=Staphylotrichum tortipilum TaxID=2831512 RepID=A0AAN6RR88_9PEZI|nr:hypothetical protein C8A05DRAFT_17779 [Staphylotrichum longicolle]
MASSVAAAPAAISLQLAPTPSSSASIPPSSTPRLPTDSPGPIIRCSFPQCPARIDGSHHVLCEMHLQAIAVTDRPRDPVRPNGTQPAPPKAPAVPGTLGPPRVSHQLPSLRKLLPDVDKYPQIMRRKTAGKPIRFIHQQPTPKHSTPSSRGASTTSPRSPRPLAPRPAVSAPFPGPVHSPPLSPGSQPNGEPVRKRQRLSPSPGRSPKAKANGTADPPRPPRDSRHALNHPPHQPPMKAEAKQWPKPSFKHPVRKMPLQLANLRFIDSPDECAPGILSEQPGSGVNGFAGNFPRRSSWESIASASSDVPLRESRKAKISNPAQLAPKEIDADRFDALIYAQSGAASPPSGTSLPALPALAAKRATIEAPTKLVDEDEDDDEPNEPLYLPIDPRIHWPQSHSETWHATKQDEIRKRGGRKANFGRAAKSLQRQLKLQQTAVTEETMLEKIAENPAWVRALRRLRGLPCSSSDESAAPSAVEAEGRAEDEGTLVGRTRGRTRGNGGSVGSGVNGGVNGGGGSGVITSKRIGNSGLVVVSGLTGAQFEMMRNA